MQREDRIYSGVGVATRVLFRTFGWQLDVVDGHWVPRHGPALIVCNHVSHVDPLIVGLAAWRRGRRLQFLAKRELFTHPLTGPLLRGTGQIEVDRGGHAARSIGPAVEALRQGGAVLVFPEGTISRSFVPAVPRLGAARVALSAGQPVIPAATWGGQRVLTKDHRGRHLRRLRFSVAFGAPVAPLPGEDPGHLTARVWDRVSALVEGLARTHPQGPRGPHDDWWLPAHLGGSAPSVREALSMARAEAEARRRRRLAEHAGRA